MPIEKKPKALAPRKPQGPCFRYRVGRKKGESWVTIAEDFRLDPWRLIKFNFLTEDPDEVNWYLREYVGCKDMTQDRNNWKFSARAEPGVIYVPRTAHRADPDSICRPPSKSMRGSLQSRRRVLVNKMKRIAKRIAHIKDFAGDDGSRDFKKRMTDTEKLLAAFKILVSIIAASETDRKSDINGRMWRLRQYEKMLVKNNEELKELADEVELIDKKLAPGSCIKVRR